MRLTAVQHVSGSLSGAEYGCGHGTAQPINPLGGSGAAFACSRPRIWIHGNVQGDTSQQDCALCTRRHAKLQLSTSDKQSAQPSPADAVHGESHSTTFVCTCFLENRKITLTIRHVGNQGCIIQKKNHHTTRHMMRCSIMIPFRTLLLNAFVCACTIQHNCLLLDEEPNQYSGVALQTPTDHVAVFHPCTKMDFHVVSSHYFSVQVRTEPSITYWEFTQAEQTSGPECQQVFLSRTAPKDNMKCLKNGAGPTTHACMHTNTYKYIHMQFSPVRVCCSIACLVSAIHLEQQGALL